MPFGNRVRRRSPERLECGKCGTLRPRRPVRGKATDEED
jgi:hypothetical protein